jgi:hypothetical protein
MAAAAAAVVGRGSDPVSSTIPIGITDRRVLNGIVEAALFVAPSLATWLATLMRAAAVCESMVPLTGRGHDYLLGSSSANWCRLKRTATVPGIPFVALAAA